MKITAAMPDESNKENTPPVCSTKGEKKNKNKSKNSIPPIAPSFKKNSKRKMKRIPLADITNVFNNSAPLIGSNGIPSALPSASVLLHSNSRRRTMVVVSDFKTLRMGFR